MGKWRWVVVSVALLCLWSAVAPARMEEPLTDDGVYSDGEDTAVLNLCSVSLPSVFEFVIDPYEIAGRGSVYSEPYRMTNTGLNTVQVEVQIVGVSAPGGDVVFLSSPADPLDAAPQKRIYLTLAGPGGQSCLLSGEGAEPLSFVLDSGETAELFLKGSVPPLSEGEWQPGDVHVSMNFQMEPIATFSVSLPETPSEGEQASEPETASPASSEAELASNSASSAEPEAISEPEEAPVSEASIESTPAATE